MQPAKAALVCLILALLACPAGAVTLHVKADGSGEYATIQSALDAATDGDVVQLAPGLYTGPGNVRLEFYANVTLEGETSWEDCFIDAYADADEPSYILNLAEETGGTIRNLTLRRGYWTNGGAVITGWGHYVFEDCRFINNHATGSGGAWYGQDGSEVDFIRCQFANNTADVSGGALAGFSSSDVTVSRGTLACNGAPEGGGIYLTENAQATVTSTVIAWSRDGGAVYDWYSAGFAISCTLIHGNRGGDWVNGAGSGLANDNLSLDPELVDPARLYSADLRPTADSPLAQLYFPCGRIGALDPSLDRTATYEVLPDGLGMFATIQAAIDAVPADSRIALVEGTYRGEGMCDLDFKGKDLALEGRPYAAHAPLLDAMAFSGGPYHRHINLDTGTPASPTFRMLNLWRGYTEDEGGSVRIGRGSAPGFENCTFRSSGSVSHGGAFFVDATGHEEGPQFQDCLFMANVAEGNGGALAALGWDVTLTDCEFMDNEALDSGGALFLADCTVTSAPGDLPNSFTGNVAAADGGAIRQTGSGGLAARDWTFTTNLAGMGGALHTDSDRLSLDGAVFDANEASHPVLDGSGGGVHATCDTIQLDGVTFTSNVVQGNGGGIMATARRLEMTGGLLETNDAGLGGSGLYFEPADSTATLVVTGTQVLDNVTGQSDYQLPGGAIYSGSCVQIFRGLDVRRNRGAGTGGIHSHQAMAGSVVDSCLFQEQTAISLHLYRPEDVLVQNSRFIANQNPSSCSLRLFAESLSAGTAVTVADCLFQDNEGAGLKGSVSLLTVRDTRFENNGGLHGGLLTGGPCTLENSTFIGNTSEFMGGGSYMGSTSLVSGCTFVSNETDGEGGGLYLASGGTVENSVFFANESQDRGAALSGGSGLVIQNCTMVANRNGGLFHPCQVYQHRPSSGWITRGVQVINSVISHGRDCGPMTVDVLDYLDDRPVIQCSITWQNEGGNYGFSNQDDFADMDPRFCDWMAGDLSLSADSPCLADNNICVQQIGALGRGECSYAAPVGHEDLPAAVELAGNFPNPFNPSTVISFGLPVAQPVSLNVYDVHGHRVRTLASGTLEAGYHQVSWNGRDDRGLLMASGVYLYRLESREGVLRGKMLMIK